MVGFKSFTKSIAVIGLSALLALVANARPAMAQSDDDSGFNVSAEKKMRFGNNVMRFKHVLVEETSDTQDLVITTSQKAITLNSITVKAPFIELGCTCVFVANNVGTQVDCDNESLPLTIPAQVPGAVIATTCKAQIAFQPDSAGKVDNPFGIRLDFDAKNSPKFVRLIGFGVE